MRTMGSLSKTLETVRSAGIQYTAVRVLEYLLLQTRLTSWCYWRTAPDLYRWWYSRATREYDAPLDPFEIERVDPSAIQRYSGIHQPYQTRKRLFGSVLAGDWDRRQLATQNDDYRDLFETTTFDESVFHRSMKDHFLDGISWRDTPFVRAAIEAAEADSPIWHGCTSREDVLERCAAVDELYETIFTEGYERQVDQAKGRPGFDEPFGFPGRICDEVIVDIGRDGELLLADGRHRLSIAKLLDLESIPVAFVVRHEEWMETREAVFRGEEAPGRPVHPDLRAVLSTE